MVSLKFSLNISLILLFETDFADNLEHFPNSELFTIVLEIKIFAQNSERGELQSSFCFSPSNLSETFTHDSLKSLAKFNNNSEQNLLNSIIFNIMQDSIFIRRF